MPDGGSSLTPQPGRVPASDLDAEAAVISAMVLDPTCIDAVRDFLKPGHMYADANRRITEAIYDLSDRDVDPDPVVIGNWLRERGRFDQVGGSPYIFQIINATPTVANVVDYAQIVVGKARTRAMTAVCQRIAAEGYGQIPDVGAWLSGAEQAVFDVAEDEAVVDAVEAITVLVPVVARALVTRKDDRPASAGGVACLTPELHRFLNGYQRGKPYLVAARPGMGKSAFALQQCIEVAKSGELAVFVSAEMSKEELVQRAVAQLAKVDSRRMAKGELLRGDYERIMAAADQLAKLPLSLSFRPAGTTAQIRGDVRRAHADQRKRFGAELRLGMVAVDYIQILDGGRQKGESRESEVGQLSKELMWMALQTDAVVLVLSQLNRDVEKRPNKRPTMVDLRDSGSLEQDAFGILFLYRDDYYNKNSSDRGICEVIIAKLREGATGKVILKWTPEYLRFDDMSPEYVYHDETADLFNAYDPEQ
jgi:replicative DNA helicase